MGQVVREDDEVSLLQEGIVDNRDGFLQGTVCVGFGHPSKPQWLPDSCIKKSSDCVPH
jgi:hypothetical protein